MTSIYSPHVHIQICSLENIMRKKKKKYPCITEANLLCLYWTEHQGIWCFGKSWITRFAERMSLLGSSAFLEISVRTATSSPQYYLGPLFCPYCGFLSVHISSGTLLPSLPLPPSSVLLTVWQLSGPTWPRLISVSYGSWRVRPSPLNTDWLAGLISSLRTQCSFPSSARRCAVRARPDREECSLGANMNWTHTHKSTLACRYTHKHWKVIFQNKKKLLYYSLSWVHGHEEEAYSRFSVFRNTSRVALWMEMLICR